MVGKGKAVKKHNIDILSQEMEQRSKFCLMYWSGSLGPKQDLDAL